MRTRLIRPEFWSDPTMADIPPATRLTYIGLWCVADDAGYLDWDPRTLGGELYRHEDPVARLAHLESELASLIELGRVRILACGRHAVVPTLPDYRMGGGVARFPVKKLHEKRCAVAGVRTGTYALGSDSLSDSDSDSLDAGARAREELSPSAEAAWRELGALYGGKPNGH